MAGGRKKRRAARAHDSGSDTDVAAEDPTMQLVQYQPQQNDFTKPFLSLLQREGNPYVALQGEGKVVPSSLGPMVPRPMNVECFICMG